VTRITVAARELRQGCRTSDGWSAAWMEKIMSKTNDTSNLATLEHHDTFADSELDAVTGGAAPKLSDAACKGTHIPNVTIELF
jgi:type VI protein secretion system component Hcp